MQPSPNNLLLSNSLARQGGFTLPEILIGLAIFTFFVAEILTPIAITMNEHRNANADAKLLAEHNNAVRRIITLQGEAIRLGVGENRPDTTNPLVRLPRYNTNWLKKGVGTDSDNCVSPVGTVVGTADEAYLRCDFADETELGFRFPSCIELALDGTVTITTEYGSIANRGYRPDLLARIVKIVNGDSLEQAPVERQGWFNLQVNDPPTPLGGTYPLVDPAAPSPYTTPPDPCASIAGDIIGSVTGDVTGYITGTVSNNRRTEEWLRRDGTVLAAADFDWGGNDITNIRDLRVVEDIYIESLDNYLSNLVVHRRVRVAPGDFVASATCPNGSPDMSANIIDIRPTGALHRTIVAWESTKTPMTQGGHTGYIWDLDVLYEGSHVHGEYLTQVQARPSPSEPLVTDRMTIVDRSQINVTTVTQGIILEVIVFCVATP